MQNVHVTLDYAVARDADWVIEAATEAIALKRQIFARIEEIVPPEAMITSNTSSLPAERIFAGLRHNDRATVTHFFAPAWRNPIVEVIRWPGADAQLLDDLNWIFCMTGKVPLVTADVPCFMLDRIFDNWCNDAALLLDRAGAAEIDTVATELCRRAVLRAQSRQRQSHHHRDQYVASEAEGEHYRPANIFHSVQVGARSQRASRSVSRDQGAHRDRMLGI